MRDGDHNWSAMVVAVLAALGVAGLLSGGRAQAPSPATADGASMPRDYWSLPLAPQGEAPAHWSEIERSLAPRSCAQCHMDKYEEWRTSGHGRAFSPGLVGQLLTFDPQQTAGCLKCHAPLAEQRQAFEEARKEGVAHLAAAQGLAAAGLACAGCHLRGGRRFGPPQRDTNLTGQSDPEAPHGGVHRATWFENSEFCSPCHQFPQEYAINGKPLENTYAEWRASPQAAAGVTCQGCHMPDRRHLWRGIHDSEMVRAGLTAEFSATAEGARFDLTNTGVGHAFPTYVTPKVVMHAVALDSIGNPRSESAVSHVIQRVVSYAGGQWIESSDTRLLPGQEVNLFLPWQSADRVRMWLEVYPDDFYDHQVYDQLLDRSPAGEPWVQLIAEADTRAGTSSYRLFETELMRPHDEE